ncbi:type III secretion system stator protein SctL [Erwinia phyllosphaerae]|uniref:type III secretion system stator protein SctL n=1 Tax=Erwinia phyllosphaerae TaxID=2853256 RepID=UPI001FF06274|nr:type III secretion system stator protein SctL [Erwinia phyllosphaerae]MBV4368607.1 type III secretion system stator protein SctL [Erwinia phyllosphaerae]
MWIEKKLAVLDDPHFLAGPLLTKEDLALHQQALTVLQAAEQQAQRKLAEAEQQAQAMLAEAQTRCDAAIAQQQQAFLLQADELFADWQRQQEQWQLALIPKAEALLVQAMSQLLAEQPASLQLAAMLQQLLKAQSRQAAATLYCAPESMAQVASWLTQHPQLDWQLISDASLASDSLRLATENGELSLDWPQLCAALIPS